MRFRLLFAAIALLIATLSHASSSRPQEVYTGIYLMNLYDLDINQYSFYADCYLWFRWKGDLDPSNIEFVNAVEKWGFTQNMFYDTARVLPDGYSYNGMRVEGRFYHAFELSSFPLDRHKLDIRFENVDHPLDSLVYIPDTAAALMRHDFIVPGWNIGTGAMRTHTNFYQTNFGETDIDGDAFSNFTFELIISRPLSYFLLKLMLPLLVVIIASLGGLLIHPNYIDARISLPIGGLLSCVFLQQSYSDAIPDVGYMVLMDRIYLLSYILIAVIMLRVIVVGNATAWGKQDSVGILYRSDRRRSFWLLIIYLIISLLLILLA
ncbi:MAG: hypothetical protein HUU34_12490 [Saprospiraceae bacterium]|jgi:hypothetical protein|nr:hypothetical protein [Saprospiraceae bacterium]